MENGAAESAKFFPEDVAFHWIAGGSKDMDTGRYNTLKYFLLSPTAWLTLTYTYIVYLCRE
jgi:hypothetical protein